MSIALFPDMTVRAAVAAVAVALAVLAYQQQRRARPRLAGSLWVVALALVGVLGAEALVAITVRLGAPDSADFNQHRWVMLAPWGRIGLGLALAAVVAIVVLAWRAAAAATPWRRALLVSLRLGAAMCAVVVFLQPAIELRQVAREPNRIAVLVDESTSMSLKDQPGGPSRLERVKQLLERSAETVAFWERDHLIDWYTFAANPTATARPAIGAGPATGSSTNIRKALEEVRGRYQDRDLAGMVLISDGAATESFGDDSGLGTTRDVLRTLDTRVHTVWAAGGGLRDVVVAKINADEFAFVRTAVRLDAVIRSTGYDARRVQVTLSSDGQPLRQKWVELPAGASDTTVSFEVTPPRVGRYVYQIATPVADDEAVTTNNARSFVVRVIRDKIRVLQVAGQPAWDVRALRQMLDGNPNVDLISFFILRTQDDISLVPNNEMTLIPFPTRELFEEQLPSFDLIVLQNFEFLPYGLEPYLENIRSYVKGGGGLAMLGGPQSFTSGGYDGTPVAATLPIDLLPESASGLLDTEKFRPELSNAGAVHPVTALRYAEADNRAAWKALPELEGVNRIGKLKSGAVVLAQHPRLKGSDGKPMPVIAVGEYGEGRSMIVATDTTWHWGFHAAARPGDDGRNYEKFWDNAIRWLIRDPDLRNLLVESDAVEYGPETPIKITARLRGSDYQPLPRGKISVVVSEGADPQQTKPTQQFEIIAGDDGTGSHDLPSLPPGIYRIRGTADVAGKKVTADEIFLVRDAGRELERPSGDEGLLRTIAEVTGGRHLDIAAELPRDLEFAPPRMVRVDRRNDVELWSRPGLLLLALLFLGAEWLLRQRTGYL